VEHSLVEWFPFLEQAMRIFDRDRAIVDEYADRQRQAAECHGVDCLTER
jgi:hypothetical protein